MRNPVRAYVCGIQSKGGRTAVGYLVGRSVGASVGAAVGVCHDETSTSCRLVSDVRRCNCPRSQARRHRGLEETSMVRVAVSLSTKCEMALSC
jgi:hypothetical protein